MNTVKVKVLMFGYFIKYVSEVQVVGLIAKDHVADIFVELVVMRRVFSNVTPQNYLT